jgi:hypothetical protein
VENPLSLRDRNNYSIDVAERDPQSSGVKRESILNQIPSFNVTSNYSVDLMHDFYEGVLHYDLSHAIQYFIYIKKYFSLENLNGRKQSFNYGSIEIKNVSPPITQSHLSNFHFKMCAREMMTFLHFLPLIIGDLVPSNDRVWLFVLNLIDINDILLLQEIPKSTITVLTKKIEVHNSEYLRLFQDDLKPKHHFLTHYPTVIQHSGPPRHFWSMRFEGKHREFKLYSKSITSRKNICLSLSKKYQFKFAYSLINKINDTMEIDQNCIISSGYDDYIYSHPGISKGNTICLSMILYKSIKYSENVCLIKYNEEKLHIFKIKHIVVTNQIQVKVLCNELDSVVYNPHYRSYIVNLNSCTLPLSLINIDDFITPPIELSYLPNGSIMIRPKNLFNF